jgi:predicted nucleic acid-binding protein
MPILLWDASALTKRYYPETGSGVVDALFAAPLAPRMIATFWGYAETIASLWRKRNRGDISATAFQIAATLIRTEIQQGANWDLLTVDDVAVLEGIDLLQRHNLNATDAAILATSTLCSLPADGSSADRACCGGPTLSPGSECRGSYLSGS